MADAIAQGVRRLLDAIRKARLPGQPHQLPRLADDHANAARLAAGLAQISETQVLSQATNMVFVQFPEAHCAPLEAFLKERGILTQMLYATRFVTHLDVSAADIDTFVAAVKAYFSTAGKRQAA